MIRFPLSLARPSIAVLIILAGCSPPKHIAQANYDTNAQPPALLTVAQMRQEIPSIAQTNQDIDSLGLERTALEARAQGLQARAARLKQPTISPYNQNLLQSGIQSSAP